MRVLLSRLWSNDDGVLSFEWILLSTLLTIGIVGGLAAMRDSLIDELGDLAEATLNIDQSYSLPGDVDLGIPDIEFMDDPGNYDDCARIPIDNQQTGTADGLGS